jgi:hypothetical protein
MGTWIHQGTELEALGSSIRHKIRLNGTNITCPDETWTFPRRGKGPNEMGSPFSRPVSITDSHISYQDLEADSPASGKLETRL